MTCKKKSLYVNMPHKVQRCSGFKGYKSQKATKLKIHMTNDKGMTAHSTRSKTVRKRSPQSKGTYTKFN